MSFIPPPNFGMVEADLYRSGQPNQLNFPFLEKLHLRKVIYLAPDEPAADFLKWLDNRQIELVHLGSRAVVRRVPGSGCPRQGAHLEDDPGRKGLQHGLSQLRRATPRRTPQHLL